MVMIEKMIAADKADCVGCYACYSVCPISAIDMKEDSEGFRYPHVDAEKMHSLRGLFEGLSQPHPIQSPSKEDPGKTWGRYR